jgi:hypothetical protein
MYLETLCTNDHMSQATICFNGEIIVSYLCLDPGWCVSN